MTGLAFDRSKALLYGRCVQAAYTMFGNDPTNLRPQPPADFPAEYQLTAWIQMQDFIVWNTGPIFYGFVAHSKQAPNNLILAIRGTSNGVEWWDDINTLGMAVFKVPNCGNVGLGFERIYSTIEIVPISIPGVQQQTLRQSGGLTEQLFTLLKLRAAATGAQAAIASQSIEVTGHSLGAALATLFVMENARTRKISNPTLCTFASPHVGDWIFVDAFNALGLTSWRIVNKQDFVPSLPPGIFYRHVNTEFLFDSKGKVQPGFPCCHSLATYLNLIDPSFPLDFGCRLPQPLVGAVQQGAAAS